MTKVDVSEDLPQKNPPKLKREPEDDYTATGRRNTIIVNDEMDEDPDLILAEISDEDGSYVTDTSIGSDELDDPQRKDSFEGGLAIESEVVLTTKQDQGEKKLKKQMTRRKKKKKAKRVFMIKEKKRDENDVFDYKKIKDQEFASFFLNGLDAKPLSSRSVIFINFYLVMRLMCYDLCYIALSFLPQAQILTMLSMETVLMMMILRA